MTKEGQPRPFLDTQKVYRQAVGDLISSEGLIEENDTVYIPVGSQSKIPVALSIDGQKRIPRSLRTHNMAQFYLFGEENQQKIGDCFGISQAGVSKAVKRATSEVFEAAPQVFGFTSLNFRKLGNARWRSTLALLEDPATDRIVAQELILEVPRGIYRRYRSKDRLEGIFLDLSTLAIEAGLRPGGGRHSYVLFIADYLRCKSVPVGYVKAEVKSGRQQGKIERYYFTTVNFVEEAKELLRTAQGERFDAMRISPTYKEEKM